MRASDPLPNNRWTMVCASLLAGFGYWLGFTVSVAAGALQGIRRLLPGRDDD